MMAESKEISITRVRGALLGLAIGDAIGTTVEFKRRDTFPEINDMIGGGPFHLKPGEWTDDTSMALCLGASILDKGFDVKDQMERYVQWANFGYMSSTGRCFDIGGTTLRALQQYQQTGNPISGSMDPHSAGNGCIMRLAPVPIAFMHDLELAIEYSAKQAETTHRAPECIQASLVFGSMLTRALNGIDKEAVLFDMKGNRTYRCEGRDHPYSQGMQNIVNGIYFGKTRDQIHGTGYVVDSLEAALWCFLTTDNYRDAVLLAANLGDDADTTAAIVGQIAGAHYGEDNIPKEWRERVAMSEVIGKMAEDLFYQQGKIPYS